jgi:hypothetical protein
MTYFNACRECLESMNTDEARNLLQSTLRGGALEIPLYFSRELTREDLMVTRMSQLVQSVREAITCVLILGILSIIWPAIIVLIMGAFLLLYSWSAEEEVVVLFWPKVGNVSFVLVSLRNSVF